MHPGVVVGATTTGQAGGGAAVGAALEAHVRQRADLLRHLDVSWRGSP
jgi:hypothetical protein